MCDMRVNGPPKSSPCPCRSAASFCRFTFYVLANKFLISCPVSIRIRNRVGLGLWPRHNTASGANIYTATGYGQRHTEKHLGFASSHNLRRHRSLLHPKRRRASARGRAGLRNRSSLRSCTGRGRIRFLGSAVRDCSNSSSRVVFRPSWAVLLIVVFIAFSSRSSPTSSSTLSHP